MKKIVISLLMGLGISCAVPKSSAQEFTEHLSKEFTLSKEASGSTLLIYNISGFIKVEGYAGTKVLVEMNKTISADDAKTQETGKAEFKLGFDQKPDSIMVYIAEPYDSRPHNNWHMNNDRQEINYQVHVDFTVKVPFAMNLHISTVNDGIVTVNGVQGNLHVTNVNAGIIITDAKGTTQAHTVNGDITVCYVSNPPEQSSYHTINGDIRVNYQPDLSADLQFKSMNGEFFTDFPDAELLPPSTTIKQEKNDGKTVYKINKTTSVRFGKGGKTFKLETLNGNVYIKKQS
jgi:hypothetical protein